MRASAITFAWACILVCAQSCGLPDVDCINDDECAAGETCSAGACVAKDGEDADPDGTTPGDTAETDTVSDTDENDPDVADGPGDALDATDDPADAERDADAEGDVERDPEADAAPDVDPGPVCDPADEPPLWIYYPEISATEDGAAIASLSTSSEFLAVGSPAGSIDGVASGAVETSRWGTTSWNTERRFGPPEPVEGLEFGTSVSLDNRRIAVSAPGAEDGGVVYIFEEDLRGVHLGSTIVPDFTESVDFRFGERVALSGTTLLVASDAVDSGQVDLYEGWDTWRRYGSLTDPNPVPGDEFGAAIDVHDVRTALAGDPADNEESGAAYVFEKSEGHWSGAIPLLPDELSAGDRFGCGIAMQGDVVFVGRCGANGGDGAVDVFERDGSRWEHEQTLTSATGAERQLGSSLIAEANSLTVAGVAPASGAAIVRFERVDGVWTEATSSAMPRAAEGTPVQVSGGWGRVVGVEQGANQPRAWHRCDRGGHGPCCLSTCDDARPGGEETGIDCGGPCAYARPVLLYSVNADTLPSIDERFFVEASGRGGEPGTVPELREGHLFFGHGRWIEFAGPTDEEAHAEAWLRPRAEQVPRDVGFEIVFDVGRPASTSGGTAQFQLRWPNRAGNEFAIGLGETAESEPAIVLREVVEDEFEVLSTLHEDTHTSLRVGIPVRVRLQVRPGLARMKVWISTSPEPEDGWVSVAADLTGAGELRWAFRAEGAADPLIVRLGNVVLRELPCMEDETTEHWFPLRHRAGADLAEAPRTCDEIMSDDTFLSACNRNTEPGYYWEMGERIGDYGFNGFIHSTLHQPCDAEHLGTVGQASAWDIVTRGVGEFVCRPSAPGQDHRDCPGIDGDIFEAGRERNGFFLATCRRW